MTCGMGFEIKNSEYSCSRGRVVHGSDGPAGRAVSGQILPDFCGSDWLSTSDFFSFH